MVILDIYKKSIKTTYKSTLLSKATILVFIFGVISVVMPFIFAYKSRGFWIKRDTFYEQPDIKFKGEYIFTATTNNLNKPISCSSLPYYEKTLKILDTCSFIKVYENDENFDGKADELILNLEVKLPEKTHLTSVCIIVPLDYRLHTICPLQMQAAIIFQGFLPIYVSTYMVTGDVMVSQSSPLICHKQHINSYYNYSIITDEEDIDSYKITSIIADYSKRNLSAVLRNIYTSFESEYSSHFTLKLKLKYPEHQLYYKPEFWQTIKWAWIQYFAIYIIISWLVTKIKNYIFNKRLVLFYEDNPVKKKQ